MGKVVVSRYVDEYVLDDDGFVRYFDDINDAKAFLRENGIDEETMEKIAWTL